MPTVTESSSTDPSPSPDGDSAAESPALRIRYRIRFAKTGLLRWISHRDLARLWERLIRRAALKLSMTEGFHPKPRVAFPSALALGVESFDEVVELELAEQLTPTELLDRLRADNQPGLTIHSVAQLPEGFGKAQLRQSDYRITAIESADAAAIEAAIEKLLAQPTLSIERKRKTVTLPVATQILALRYDKGEGLLLSLAETSDSTSLRPGDVLDLLGLSDWIANGATITRVRVLLKKEFEPDDPSLRAIAADSDTTGTTAK